MERPNETMTLTFTRSTWGIIAKAIEWVAKRRRDADARNPYIPPPGHRNHNLLSAAVLSKASNEIKDGLTKKP